MSDSGGVLAGAYSTTSGSQTEWRAFTLSLRGDMNWDGVVDFFDIDSFLLGLFNQSDISAAIRLGGCGSRRH